MATLTAEEAARMLAAYRSDHVIDPEYPRGTRFENYCRVDGIRISETGRGQHQGWRHDLGEVAKLVAIAPVGSPW